MKNSCLLLLSLLFVVSLVCQPAVGALKWTNGDHANNDYWSNAANWAQANDDPGYVPTSADQCLCIMAAATPAPPTVVSPTATASRVDIGYWGFDGQLNIASPGVLNVATNVYVGNQENTGILTMDGGTLNASVLFVGTLGNGTCTVDNGAQVNLGTQIVIGDGAGHSGEVKLLDGTMNVGKLYMALNDGTGLLNVHAGTFVVVNAVGVAQYNSILTHYNAGRIIGYDGFGTVSIVYDGNQTTTITASVETNAFEPYPADLATGLPQGVVISWKPGWQAAEEDIYFGTNELAVMNATPTTPGIYRGRQDVADGNFYILPEPNDIALNDTFYWRVDEVEADGTTIHTGNVWEYTTATANPTAYIAFSPPGGSGYDEWFTPSYWTTGYRPTSYTKTTLYKPTENPVIRRPYAFSNECKIGLHGFTTAATVASTGKLTATRIDIGAHNAGSNGTLYVNGGEVVVDAAATAVFHVGYNAGNFGTLELNEADGKQPLVTVDGQFDVGMQSGSVGEVYLNAGELHCNAFYMGNNGGSALLDIRQGKLIIHSTFNLVGKILNEYASSTPPFDNTAITAYGGHPRGQLFAEFDSVAQTTTVWAIGPDDPCQAWMPDPTDGATDVQPDQILSWGQGDYAVAHDVYFGTDYTAVANADTGTAGIYQGQVAGVNPEDMVFDPGTLTLGQTYYWRVDEVQSGGSPVIPGVVWSFTLGDCLVIDDFGTAADPNTVDWVGANVALAMQDVPNISGRSLRSIGNGNAGSFTKSLSFGDWAGAGVESLAIYFLGSPDNAPATMSVTLTDGAAATATVNYDGSANDVVAYASDPFTGWHIDIDAFAGVNLANVSSIKINTGANSNTVYFDNVMACTTRCFDDLKSAGDLDGDCDVDGDDLDALITAWLNQGSTLTVDNIENYVSQAQLATFWNSYLGHPAGGTSTFDLLVGDAFEGNQACRWNYHTDNGDVVSEIVVNIPPIDMTQYDQLRFWIRRQPGNTVKQMFYVKLFDTVIDADHTIAALIDETTTSDFPSQWYEVVFDLHTDMDFTNGVSGNYSDFSDIGNVVGIMFGTWGGDGTGTIDIDDIRLVDTIAGDGNGDGAVNMGDFAPLGADWMDDGMWP